MLIDQRIPPLLLRLFAGRRGNGRESEPSSRCRRLESQENYQLGSFGTMPREGQAPMMQFVSAILRSASIRGRSRR